MSIAFFANCISIACAIAWLIILWVQFKILGKSGYKAASLEDYTVKLESAYVDEFYLRIDREDALKAIRNATATGKSGTAVKIHRMATEALK